METHPLAELIPPMSDDEFAALRSDIAENGLLEPIWIYEGKILDGRHRARACSELGREPKTQEFDGDGAARFVLSMNVHRRHLTTTQRALIAKAVMPHFKDEAKVRMAEGGRGGSNSTPSKKARDEAGALVGTSGKTVAQLERVEREAPDLYEKVVAGEQSINGADQQVRHRRNGTSPAPRALPSLPGEGTKRREILLNAAKDKVDHAVTQLGTFARALPDLDLDRAREAADDETARYWTKTAEDAGRHLRDFRRALGGT